MSNIFRQRHPGDPLNGLPAELINAIQWTVQREMQRNGYLSVGPMVAPEGVSLHVRNDSGDGLIQYAIVARGDPVIAPGNDDGSFFGRTVFESASPDADLPFAVLQMPSINGEVVPAIANGETYCWVDITDLDHEYAAPDTGVYENLLSQEDAGPARILWGETSFADQLNGGINNSVTTIVLDSTEGLLVDHVILIGTEQLLITDVDDDGVTLTVTRGHNATVAASHADNAAITFYAGVVWCRCLLDMNMDGGAVSSIVAITSGTFTIPAVTSSATVNITSAVDTSIWMVVGQTLVIQDGTRRVYGYVASITNATQFSFTTTRVAAGTAGQTMSTAATVIISGDPVGSVAEWSTSADGILTQTTQYGEGTKSLPDGDMWRVATGNVGAGVNAVTISEFGLRMYGDDSTATKAEFSYQSTAGVGGGSGTGEVAQMRCYDAGPTPDQVLSWNIRALDWIAILRGGSATAIPSFAIWDPNTGTEMIGVHKTLAQAISDGDVVVGGIICPP